MADTEKPASPDGAAPAASADTKPATPASEPAPPQRPQERARTPRSGRLAAGLALFFAFVALLGSGYLWYLLVYQRPDLMQLDVPQTLARLDRAADELRTSIDEQAAALREIEGRIDTLAETQGTLRAAIGNLQANVGRNQVQWQVAEAEQLLLIANRRLQLARDVETALAALRAADRQLERLANPNLLPVRREIAREIAALESLERADVAGIALRLGSLAERADELAVDPDLQRRAQQVAAAGGATDAGDGIWQDLLSLVRIRRHEEPQKPLLAPEQQYFARQNLRLMLYGAQHALLQGNIATYEQNLATASRWLDEYFDPQAAGVRAAREEIAKLQSARIATEMPDISASLEMLRQAAAEGQQPS